MSKYLIIGGNSDIAIEFARILLKKNNEIILSSNDLEKLSFNVKKLEIEFNTKIKFLHLDIENLNSFDEIISHLDSDIKNLFFSSGYLEKYETNIKKIEYVNYLGPKIFIEKILRTRNLNKIIAITSISADRIDYNKKVYSRSKKLFTEFLRSLIRLDKNDLKIKIIKPGYVKTKMIKNLNIPSILTISPKKLSQQIFKKIDTDQTELVIPHYWKMIIFIFNLIFFYKK